MPALWIPKRLVEISLINTAALTKEKFVLHCEHQYQARIFAAAKDIISENKPIIMITGPSASGKTTTANKIKERLIEQGKTAQVISLDNFFKNKDNYPLLKDGSKDYENVTALEIPVFKECIDELLQKKKAHFPYFDFKTEIRHDKEKLIELNDGFLIIEGIHALNPLLLDIVGKSNVFTIYAGLREEYSNDGQRVFPTRDIRLLRRMIRDAKHRGHTPQKTIAMWENVCIGEDTYIKVHKPNADLLLDTAFSYEILVMSKIVKDMAKDLDLENQESKRLNEILKVLDLISPMPFEYIPKDSMLMEFYD